MAHIGLALALSIRVNIPILIRTLAIQLHPAGHIDAPLLLSAELKLNLDAGIDPDKPEATVPTYLHDWWNHTRRRKDAMVLGPRTVKDCLAHHSTQKPLLSPGFVLPLPTNSNEHTRATLEAIRDVVAPRLSLI